MKAVRLTEKPSGNQIWVNWNNVNWFYQVSDDMGQSTKIEFNNYNVLVKETPDTVMSMLEDED